MTTDKDREAFKKVLPCHPEVYWHETMKRWVTNGAYLLEAHAYNCQWEGFQAGSAVARVEEPVAWLTDDGGVAMASTVSRFGNANIFNIPLYTSPPIPADSVALREQLAAGDALRILMSDVPKKILGWASYANVRFREKYGMQDDVDRYKKALAAYDAAISKGETK